MVKAFKSMTSKWSKLKKMTYEISYNLCAKQIRYFIFKLKIEINIYFKKHLLKLLLSLKYY